MSAARKKKVKEPSVPGAIVLGVITALIGAFLGFVFLTGFKAQAFSSWEDLNQAAKPEQAGEVKMPSDAYYLEGPRTGGSGWQLQRERFFSGTEGDIDLSVGELNAWMASSFRPSNSKPKGEQSNLTIIPGTPNFFAEESGRLSINLPTEIIFFGKSYKYMISARGHFTGGARVSFEFDHLQVNSAPIPAVAILVDQVAQILLVAFSATDEYVAIADAWKKVESVEVATGSIRIKLR